MANANINNIVKRSSKNRPLTFQEGDQNLEELINVIEDQQNFETTQGQTNSALSQSINDLEEDVSGVGGVNGRLSLAEQSIDNLEQFETNLGNSSTGNGSDLIAHTGTSDTVTEALDKRAIYVDTVADLQELDTSVLADGQQVSVLSYHAPVWGSDQFHGGGTFCWNEVDLSTKVAIDTNHGVYVPPSSDQTGASGAWVRRFSGVLSASAFGILPATDIDPIKITAAIHTLGSGGGITFDVPGEYRLQTLSDAVPGVYVEGVNDFDMEVASGATITATVSSLTADDNFAVF